MDDSQHIMSSQLLNGLHSGNKRKMQQEHEADVKKRCLLLMTGDNEVDFKPISDAGLQYIVDMSPSNDCDSNTSQNDVFTVFLRSQSPNNVSNNDESQDHLTFDEDENIEGFQKQNHSYTMLQNNVSDSHNDELQDHVIIEVSDNIEGSQKQNHDYTILQNIVSNSHVIVNVGPSASHVTQNNSSARLLSTVNRSISSDITHIPQSSLVSNGTLNKIAKAVTAEQKSPNIYLGCSNCAEYFPNKTSLLDHCEKKHSMNHSQSFEETLVVMSSQLLNGLHSGNKLKMQQEHEADVKKRCLLLMTGDNEVDFKTISDAGLQYIVDMSPSNDCDSNTSQNDVFTVFLRSQSPNNVSNNDESQDHLTFDEDENIEGFQKQNHSYTMLQNNVSDSHNDELQDHVIIEVSDNIEGSQKQNHDYTILQNIVSNSHVIVNVGPSASHVTQNNSSARLLSTVNRSISSDITHIPQSSLVSNGTLNKIAKAVTAEQKSPNIYLGCSNCAEYFPNKTSLLDHCEKKHSMNHSQSFEETLSSQLIFVLDGYGAILILHFCCECKQGFESRNLLSTHAFEIHKEQLVQWETQEVWRCCKCKCSDFSNIMELHTHVVKEHGYEIYQKETNPRKNEIKETMQIRNEQTEAVVISQAKEKVEIGKTLKKYLCSLCEQDFLSPEKYKDHIVKIHKCSALTTETVEEQMVAYWQCNICNQSKPSHQVLFIQHLQEDHKMNTILQMPEEKDVKALSRLVCYQCPHCSFHSDREASCIQHIKIYHACSKLSPANVSIIGCLTCHKLFVTMEECKEHQPSCNPINKNTAANYSNQDSSITARNMICTVKLVNVKNELKSSIQVKMQKITIRYFPCPMCNINFRNEAQCRAHIQTNHRVSKALILPRVYFVFYCHDCCVLYNTIMKFKMHVMSCSIRKGSQLTELDKLSPMTCVDFKYDNFQAIKYYQRCDQCMMILSDGLSLIHHQDLIHSNKLSLIYLVEPNKHKCINMENYWESLHPKQNLNKHELNVLNNFDKFEKIDYICAYCSKTFCKKNVLSHLKKNHSKRPVKYYKRICPLLNCKTCNQCFFSMEECTDHFNICNLETKATSFDTCIFICTTCNMDINSTLDLATHNTLEHDQKCKVRYRIVTLYQCDKCLVVLNLASKMKFHVQTCTGSSVVRHADTSQDKDVGIDLWKHIFKIKLVDIKDYRMSSMIFHRISSKAAFNKPLKDHLSELRVKASIHHFGITDVLMYCCFLCTQIYNSTPELSEHLKNKHNISRDDCHRIRSRGYKCKVCGYIIFSVEQLNEHRKTCLFSNITYKLNSMCVSCHVIFESSAKYNMHMMNVHSTNLIQIPPDSKVTYHCYKCSNVFQYLAHLESHMEFCTNRDDEFKALEGIQEQEKTYICQVCSLDFLSKIHVDNHIKTVHTLLKSIANAFFTCEVCNTACRSQTILNIHTKQCQSKSKIAQYLYKNTLKKYLKNRRNKIKLKLKNIPELTAKQLPDELVTPCNIHDFYLCKVCRSFCASLKSVYEHMEKHKKKLTHIKQQISIFNCIICDVAFNSLEKCKVHVREDHKMLEPITKFIVNTAFVSYNCIICSKQYMELLLFAAHMSDHGIQIDMDHLRSVNVSKNKKEFCALQTQKMSIIMPFNVAQEEERIKLAAHRSLILKCSQNLVFNPHFVCPICDLQFLSIQPCIEHFKLNHFSKKKIQFMHVAAELFQCSVCSEVHHSIAAHLNHISSHIQSQSLYAIAAVASFYFCSKCMQKFSTAYDAHNHVTQCDFVHKLFECDVMHLRSDIFTCLNCCITLKDSDLESVLLHLRMHGINNANKTPVNNPIEDLTNLNAVDIPTNKDISTLQVVPSITIKDVATLNATLNTAMLNITTNTSKNAGNSVVMISNIESGEETVQTSNCGHISGIIASSKKDAHDSQVSITGVEMILTDNTVENSVAAQKNKINNTGSNNAFDCRENHRKVSLQENEMKNAATSSSSKSHASDLAQKSVDNDQETTFEVSESKHFYCNLCNKHFDSGMSIQLHCQEHSASLPLIRNTFFYVVPQLIFTCMLCNDLSFSQLDCMNHFKKDHSVVEKVKSFIKTQVSQIYYCKYCNSSKGIFFSDYQIFIAHMKTHNITIKEDLESIYTPNNPVTHISVRLIRFYCGACPRKFSTKLSCLMHMQQSHAGMFENVSQEDTCFFICKFCNKLFISENKLYDHLQQHKDSENRNDKNIMRKSNCTTFTCLVCSKIFMKRCSIIHHLKSKHLLTDDFASNLEKKMMMVYRCNLCERSKPKQCFFNYKSLTNHLKEIHLLFDLEKKLQHIDEAKSKNDEEISDDLFHHEIIIKDEILQDTLDDGREETLNSLGSSLEPDIEKSAISVGPLLEPVIEKRTLSVASVKEKELPLVEPAKEEPTVIVMAPGPGGSYRVKVTSFQCRRCKSKFNSSEQCEQHIRSVHSYKQDMKALMLKESIIWFQCCKCKQLLKSVSLLSIHTRECSKATLPRQSLLRPSQSVCMSELEEGEVIPVNNIKQEPLDLESPDFVDSSMMMSTEHQTTEFDPLEVEFTVKTEVKQEIDRKLTMYPCVVLHRLAIDPHVLL